MKFETTKKNTYTPIRKRHPKSIATEYINQWLTIENMAQWYGVPSTWLRIQVERGQYLLDK